MCDTLSITPIENSLPNEEILKTSMLQDPFAWTLHFDGAKNKGSARASVIIHSPNGYIYYVILCLKFLAFKNIMKYETLILDIYMALDLGIHTLYILG